MTSFKRFLIGGAGALSVFAFWAAVTDLETIANGIRHLRHGGGDAWIYVFGYLIRACGLFVSGGIAAGVFHPNEKTAAKLFQLGMAGPALMAAVLGVKGVGSQATAPNLQHKSAYLSLATVAHAQAAPHIVVTRYPTLSTPPAREQVWAGIFADPPLPRRFYVIVGSTKEKDAAVKLAQEYAQKFPLFHYAVYEPYESDHYGVSIGSFATFGDADKLRREAVKLGFPETTFVKAVP